MKKIASLALAAASLTGAGVAVAGTASASAPYVHNAAHYSSASECNYYRSGSITNIRNHGGTGISAGSCHKVSSYYTYGSINYIASHPLISGDKIDLG